MFEVGAGDSAPILVAGVVALVTTPASACPDVSSISWIISASVFPVVTIGAALLRSNIATISVRDGIICAAPVALGVARVAVGDVVGVVVGVVVRGAGGAVTGVVVGGAVTGSVGVDGDVTVDGSLHKLAGSGRSTRYATIPIITITRITTRTISLDS